MAKRQPLPIIPVPMQYRNPNIATCGNSGCSAHIIRDSEEHVHSRVTGKYYCDKTCVVLGEARMHPDHEDLYVFEGELKSERQILVELEVVSHG
jgi:hypothetical protein